MNTRKLITGLVVGSMLMGATLPAFAQTASTSQLQSLFQSLQAQIATLQAQLAARQQLNAQIASSTVSVAGTLQLIAQLRQGMSGDDVKTLQTILAADPSVFPEGKITGFFGTLTAQAVKRFQKKHGFEQTGNVGPKTLKELNKFLSENPLGKEKDEDNGGLRPCVPPGHLIAPGWLRKVASDKHDNGKGHGRGENSDNEDFEQVIKPCMSTSTPPTPPPPATSTPDTTAPVLSAIQAVSITSSGAQITWTTNESATSLVWYGTSSPVVATSTTASATASGLIMAHAVNLTGLQANTTYHYVVVSADASGNTTSAAELTFTTLPAPDTTAPVISGISVSNITSSSAQISWSTNELANGKVWYSTSTPVTTGNAQSVSTTSLLMSQNFTLTGLSASTTYHYTITAQDGLTNTTNSGESSFMTAAQ